MRWRPVALLSMPHALSEGTFPIRFLPSGIMLIEWLIADEWVDGKLLPKGTICLLNVWGLHHDESKFPNSNNFDPDHFEGRTLPAAEYANSADYENRDHYGYGTLKSNCCLVPVLTGAINRQRPPSVSWNPSGRSWPFSSNVHDALGIQYRDDN